MQIDNILPRQKRLLRIELLAVSFVCSAMLTVVLLILFQSMGDWSIGRSIAAAGAFSLTAMAFLLLLGEHRYTGTPAVEIVSAGPRGLSVRNRGAQPVTVRIGVVRILGEADRGGAHGMRWTATFERETAPAATLAPGQSSAPFEAPESLPPFDCTCPGHGEWARTRFFGVEVRQGKRHPLYVAWLETTHGALFMGHRPRSRVWWDAVSEFDFYLREVRMPASRDNAM